MYTLLSRIDQGLEPLKSNFEKHVKQVGLDEISKEAKEAGEVCLLSFIILTICVYLYKQCRNLKYLLAFCFAFTENTQT